MIASAWGLPGMAFGLWVMAVAPVTAASGDDCSKFLAEVADWDREVEAIVVGEPEDQLRRITEAIEARQSGDPAAAPRIAEGVATKRDRLLRVVPPPAVRELQSRLEHYLAAVHRAVAAIADPASAVPPVAGWGLPATPEVRRAVEALLAYLEEMLRILDARDCDEGDRRALREKAIPELRRFLEQPVTAAPAGRTREDSSRR